LSFELGRRNKPALIGNIRCRADFQNLRRCPSQLDLSSHIKAPEKHNNGAAPGAMKGFRKIDWHGHCLVTPAVKRLGLPNPAVARKQGRSASHVRIRTAAGTDQALRCTYQLGTAHSNKGKL
jgi:hypothetical protein